MDADTEVKRQSPVEEQLEPLVILEDGDELDTLTHVSPRGKAIQRAKTADTDVEETGDRMEGRSVQTEKSEVEREVLQVTGTGSDAQEVQTVAEVMPERKGAEEVGGSSSDTVVKGEVEIQSEVQLRPKDLLRPQDAHQKVNGNAELGIVTGK